MKFLVRNFQHLHHLRPGAGGIGREFSIAGAVGDVLLVSPLDGFRIPTALRHICKRRHVTGGSGRTGGPPQESGHLGSGAGGVWGELPVAGAAGDALFHSPQHRVIIVCVSAHVRERIGDACLGEAADPPEECHHLRPGSRR